MPEDFKQTADAALRKLDHLQAEVSRVGEAAEVGTAAGLVAHEIRNLLTPAVAYAQIAMRGGTDPVALRQALERAHTAMRRACEVSELILTQLRVDHSDPKSNTSVTSMTEVVADCISSLGWDHQIAGFELAVDVPDGILVAIAPEALRHVILNLLLNARTSLAVGGGRIAIELDPQSRSAKCATWNTSGERVKLRITDNGRGIEPIKLQRIRAGLSANGGSNGLQQSTPGYRHAGLGLILCNRLLHANGAELHIDSRENAGTVAVVELRIAA